MNGWVAASFYGPQSRVMDGVLARANCLLITTLWAAFKFVMVPIGAALARVFQPADFAVVFALIWGSYLVTDALAEIGGALFGKQRLRVWGIGDVNRKSVGGTVSGFVGALVFCTWLVRRARTAARRGSRSASCWQSPTRLLELFSPRGHRRLLHGDRERADLLGVRGPRDSPMTLDDLRVALLQPPRL